MINVDPSPTGFLCGRTLLESHLKHTMLLLLLTSRSYRVSVGVLFLVIGSDAFDISASNWIQGHDFENNLDTSVVIGEMTETSLITCGSLCDRNPSCMSFFHHASLKKCLVSQSYKRGFPVGQTVPGGSRYYTKRQFCDGGYVYNQTLGLCYKNHNESLLYADAMAACEAEGAKLMIIRNEAEFQHITIVVQNNFDTWIGLRGINANSEWKWWNGQSAAYMHWFITHPNLGAGYQACVDIYAGQYWDDICDSYQASNFLCQKEV